MHFRVTETEIKSDRMGNSELAVTLRRPAEGLPNVAGMVGKVVDVSVLDTFKEPLFGGAYYDQAGNFVYIKEVLYKEPAVIVFWSDGTKTLSICDERDTYNPEFGLTLAVMKKLVSGTFVAKTLHDWAPEEGQTKVSMKDVRKKSNFKKGN